MSPGHADEFAFLEWIRAQGATKRKRIEIDVGDDACALDVTGQRLVLITADMLLEGTHFDLIDSAGGTSATSVALAASARQVGRKAVAVNLSDVAAMGVPAAALLV